MTIRVLISAKIFCDRNIIYTWTFEALSLRGSIILKHKSKEISDNMEIQLNCLCD